MRKNFKNVWFIVVVLLCSNLVLGQSKPIYKDVLLNGKPAKLNIATGEFILVNGKQIDTVKSLEFDNKEAVNKRNASIAKAKQTTTKASFDAVDNSSAFHTVKAGETLFALAKKYGVTLKELKKANNLETTLVSVGQKLRIKDFDKVNEIPDTIKVAKGNTLYSISKTYGITVKALKQINGLKTNTIFIGQELRLK